MKSNFLIGGDPEFPCIIKGINEYQSLINIVEGTKKDPKPIALEGCFQQLDNVMIEFTLPPMKEYWMYKSIIDDCIEYTNKWLAEIDPMYSLDIVSSARYNMMELDNEQAMTFGCEPSYSVYRNDISFRPGPAMVGNLRSCGYHIHYGWDEKYTKEELHKFMILNDVFLGFQSMYYDKDVDRRKLYGNLSDHRIIGKDQEASNRIEYRVLGAGIHNYPQFVDYGIKMIKKVLDANLLDEYYDKYYDNLKLVDDTEYSKEACKKLKNKLIRNNDFIILETV